MALKCPVCSAENRAAASFCLRCGSRLTSNAASGIPPAPRPSKGREWATTAPAQLRAPTIPAPLIDMAMPPSAPPMPWATAAGSAGEGRATAVPPKPARRRKASPDAARHADADDRAPRRRTHVARHGRAKPVSRRTTWLVAGLFSLAAVAIGAGWASRNARHAAASECQAAEATQGAQATQDATTDACAPVRSN